MTGVDEVRGHEFDGIEEYDNRLPNWWLWTFFGACIFSVAYWGYYEIFNGPSSQERYEAQVAELEKRQAEIEAAQDPVTDESILALLDDPEAVKEGKEVFMGAGICFSCHGMNLAGMPSLGVNLTDDHWKHGVRPTEIYATIWDGIKDTAMPAHKKSLGRNRIEKVVAYLLSPEVKNTNVKGEPPEGKTTAEWEKEGN